jgi:predicted phosphoadenosine phosphosulfate sulfurtransferase
VKVVWLDQEAEWRQIVEYVRSVMTQPDVTPLWFQGHFRLFNATTTGADPWEQGHDPGEHERRCASA